MKLKKSEGSLIMNTFRNKHFKNELDPKYAFYDCLRSCELQTNSEQSLEECIISFKSRSLSKNLDRSK